jgi:hypothetical protein
VHFSTAPLSELPNGSEEAAVMTMHEELEKVGQELQMLALSHGVCIAAVVTAGEGEGLALVANAPASHPLALLRATRALEEHAEKFVAKNATEAYHTLAKQGEVRATHPAAGTDWTKEK